MQDESPNPDELFLPVSEAAVAEASVAKPRPYPDDKESPATPQLAQEQAPMLDVHPPHNAAHSWKDFFIHIATIVLGLLIAVGLEQMVEHIHHRYQLAETREVLRKERDLNHLRMAYTTAGLRLEAAALRNNYLVLQYARQHPGTTEDKLPGVMTWTYHWRDAIHSGWLSAQQLGVTSLMTRQEVDSDEALYGLLAGIETYQAEFIQSFAKASRYAVGDPDITHMTPQQLDEELALLEDAIEADHLVGSRLVNLHELAPDFQTISRDELDTFNPAPKEDRDPRLAPARTLTDSRLAQAWSAFDDSSKALARYPNQN